MKKVCGQRTDIRGIVRGPRGPKKTNYFLDPQRKRSDINLHSGEDACTLRKSSKQSSRFKEKKMFVADGWLDGPASKVLKALLLVCIRPLFLTKLNTVDQHEWENRVL